MLTRPYGKIRPSSLRRINLDLDVSDAKYNGVRTSRQQLLEDDTNDNVDDELTSDGDDHSDHSEDDESEASGPSDGESLNDADDQPARPPVDPSQSLQEQDLTSALQASRLADRQKGKAISRQLVSLIRRRSH